MLNPNATHLLIRHQEIALKGKNRPEFERRLRTSLSRCVGDAGRVTTASGRFVIELARTDAGTALNTTQLSSMIDRLATVAGISAITPCKLVPSPDLETISAETVAWAKHDLAMRPEAKTFALRSRRVNKQFPLSSNQLDNAVGPLVLDLREGMTVNLKRPDLKIAVEVRYKHALIYSWEKAGVKGLPVDATQRVVCLLSGGIDSPVAAYDVMRRGCTPVMVHFHSKPFTSEASVAKVKRLAAVVRKHSPHPLELWLIPLLEIQKAVRDNCNERHRTVHYRRFMMKLAEELARRRGAKAIVTGEALGQVASQTLSNMQAIDEVVGMTVLRPLVTHDKDQIIAKAKLLGSYEISIEPHDDTCVLFAPERPATQARAEVLREEEGLLPTYSLIFSALDAAEKILLT